MAKFGLGRGLADLKQEMGTVPDISILTGTERVVVRQIPLSQIAPNPDQPRKTFSDAELADLAASIREKGVLQPILLRTVKNAPHMYEIVAGERRFRASQMAGLAEIPALVKNIDNQNAMEIALIENVQRENLNPIEEAAAYKNLMEKCGYEIGDVSRLIGKSESYIRNIMRLESLPDSVKLLVEQGRISASHARTIAVAENPEKLAHEIIEKGMSVADAQRATARAKRSTTRRNAAQSDKIPDSDVKKIESEIKNAVGFPVKLVQRRGGAGQISISFATRTQMYELIEKLSGK